MIFNSFLVVVWGDLICESSDNLLFWNGVLLFLVESFLKLDELVLAFIVKGGSAEGG